MIDLEGHVHAFPRQLRLRPDILRQQIAPVPKLSYGGPLDPLALGWVLNIRYNPLGTWRPRALTPGQMLLALLENTVAVRTAVGVDRPDPEGRGEFRNRVAGRARRRDDRRRRHPSIA